MSNVQRRLSTNLKRKVRWLLYSGIGVGIVLILSTFGNGDVKRFREIKKRVDVTKLQKWAVETIQAASKDDPPLEYQTNQPLPEIVRTIPSFGLLGPFGGATASDGEHVDHIELLYFDSFGNAFCISIGGPRYKLATNKWCFEWAPGVYYQKRSHGTSVNAEHPTLNRGRSYCGFYSRLEVQS